MKNLKIMLLSMAVLAIIGGALAFKARFGPFTYCTLTANWDDVLQSYTYTAGLPCLEITKVTTTNIPAHGTPAFFTIKRIQSPCSQVTCTTFTYFKANQ